MKLRTYLSSSQVMVAPLVLIFSRSGYQWHLTTNEQLLAAPKKTTRFFTLRLVKGSNAIVTVRSNFLGLEKQAFQRNYLTIWSPSFKLDLLKAVVSEESRVKPKKPCFREKNGTRARV